MLVTNKNYGHILQYWHSKANFILFCLTKKPIANLFDIIIDGQFETSIYSPDEIPIV